ncbi:MAG: non-motile and phage-resistance protein [Pseudomonadota bacterium]|jgi:PAS domain S-box-containing protein
MQTRTMDHAPFFELSLDLLAVANAEGRFVDVNPAWELALGRTRAEMTAGAYLDLIHPDDRAGTTTVARAVLAGERVAGFENRYRHSDGHYIWLQWSAVLRREDGLIYSIARDVTVQKRTTEHLRIVQTTTRVGTWEVDLVTQALFWSEATHAIHETDPATFRPSVAKALSFYRPERAGDLIAAMDALVRRGDPFSLELPFVTAKGRDIWVRATATAILADGKPVRVFGTFEDVTEEREERQRLLAFKDIVDLASDGICVLAADGRVGYANGRMAGILGLADPAALADRPLDAFASPGWEEAVRTLAGGTGAMAGERRDMRMRRVDGQEIWVAASVRARDGSDGTPASAILLLRDVTERKTIEMELAASRHRLEEAQSIARLGHWEANLATGALYWSDVIYEIFGLDKAAVTPSLEVFNGALHPDDVAKVRASEERAARTGIHDVEHRIIRPGGEVRWVRELARMLPDGEGQPVRLVGTVQDITHQKEVEEALVAARQAAEQASHAKSAFLATMSHELRTPLNAIIGFSEIIRDGTFGAVSPPIYREYAGHVHESAVHLLEIINDVLDLAKIEAHAITLAPTRLSIAEKIRRAVQTVMPMADQAGVRIVTADGPDLTIRADRRATLQALFNILSNAVRHSPTGEIVEVATREAAGYAVITVRDKGPGFPPDVLVELGQPYPGQSDSYRSAARSTGLGFAITAALLKAQGGDIHATNNPDHGATVTLRLPLAEGE